MLCIVKLELRCVHAYGEPSGAGCGIVTAKRSLPPFVKPAIAIQGQWMCGDYDTIGKRVANSGFESLATTVNNDHSFLYLKTGLIVSCVPAPGHSTIIQIRFITESLQDA
jgi:hypothetical protein